MATATSIGAFLNDQGVEYHRDAIKMRYSDHALLTSPIVGAFGAGVPSQ